VLRGPTTIASKFK